MFCDKIEAESGLLVKGVEVRLEWGISDRVRKTRKTQTRFLYVHALSGGSEKFTENWQPEVNKLMEQIESIIGPLFVDKPAKNDLNRMQNATGLLINKMPLDAASARAARARTRHASAQGTSAAGPSAAVNPGQASATTPATAGAAAGVAPAAAGAASSSSSAVATAAGAAAGVGSASAPEPNESGHSRVAEEVSE